ncbi:MAG: helix-hairpin-helix domain-containing protein [Psychromonas sp.]
MFKKLTYSLMLAASLLLLSTSMQTLAANNSAEKVSTLATFEKININQASSKQLASIKGIGPQKAQAIIKYRESNGGFSKFEELMKVKGIGKGTLEKIIPFISL